MRFFSSTGSPPSGQYLRANQSVSQVLASMACGHDSGRAARIRFTHWSDAVAQKPGQVLFSGHAAVSIRIVLVDDF
jgi:hypothetical protein